LLTLLKAEDEFLKLKEAAEDLEQDRADKLVSQVIDQTQTAIHATDWSLRDLRVEYNRLFLGPTPPLAPPYESVYDQNRSEEDLGTVQGPSASIMESALAEEGLELDMGRVDLYDHIAIELEFMYYLLSKAVENEVGLNHDYVDRANSFLKDRLAKWAPEFGEKVASKTDHRLYHNLGRLLAEYVRLDAEQK
jgi:TorA maturation chaperone TorD